MTTPQFRNKKSGTVSEAIQFIKDDPTTHWHVNLGHPVAEALKDKFWSRTLDGPTLVEDKDWIVRTVGANSDCVQVVKQGPFVIEFERVIPQTVPRVEQTEELTPSSD